MDTQNQNASKLPSIRTYAKDLESKRQEKSQSLPTEPAIVVTETPAPKESFLKKKKPLVVSMPPIVVEDVSEPEKKPVPRPAVTKLNVGNISAFNTKSPEFIVDNEDAAAATIITDTKHNRFKLLPAIISSIKGWFADQKDSYEQKKRPKYTVPETSRRKGVIQKATSLTGKVATADFSSIHERIRQRKDEPEEESARTSWSAKTEPGFLLLETSKNAAVTNVQFVSRKSYRTSPQEVIVNKEPVAAVVVPPAPAVSQRTPVVVAQPEPEVVIEAPKTPTTVQAPATQTLTQPDQREEGREPMSFASILQIDTNTLALGVSAAVLVLAIFGTYAVMSISNDPEVVNLTASETIPLIDSDLHEVSLDSIALTTVFEALVEVRSSLENTTQVVFKTSDQRPIPAHLLLPPIGFNLEQNFLKTLTQTHFGYTRDRQPFVLLKAADPIVAKGGLLIWEETMGVEVNNLFGITGIDLRPTFIDATLSGVDVRVLKTESGTERLLYGVVENMIIIATNSADFTELVNLRIK